MVVRQPFYVASLHREATKRGEIDISTPRVPNENQAVKVAEVPFFDGRVFQVSLDSSIIDVVVLVFVGGLLTKAGFLLSVSGVELAEAPTLVLES